LKKQPLESDFLSSLVGLIKDDPTNKTFLLGVSGGSDSICLANLFFNCGISFCIAHVNYKLRGAASELDKAFVESWAESKNIPCYILEVDTREILSSQGGNMQELARNIRYSFFKKVKLQQNIDFVCTAHHASDWVETIVFNFFRGGFLNAFVGMPEKNIDVLRPLLFLEKSSIDAYIKKMNIGYRTDESNQKLTYSRNLIRHKILPLLNKVNPSLVATFIKNKRVWQEWIDIKNDFFEREKVRIVSYLSENEFFIDFKELEKCKAPHIFLYELLSPLGFTSGLIFEIGERMKKKMAIGSVFIHQKWKIITLEHCLRCIKTSDFTSETSQIEIVHPGEYTFFHNRSISMLHSKKIPNNLNQGRDIIFVDAKNIVFPLTVRKWSAGDFFYPLNMNNQKKKVQDYLTDNKVDRFDKQNVFILLNADGNIVWIIGFRQDNRFKIQPNSEQIIIFEHKII
jgi:tRNA(Ile)-lysidine synthase